MRIGGLIKTSALDYPSRISAVIFTSGCNFRCPYCHNPGLVRAVPDEGLARTDVLALLEKRRGFLDGVVLSGGEPTIQPDLPEFLTEIKRLGYLIKLDTNGSNPLAVERLIASSLVDYVALDLKTEPGAYAGLLPSEPGAPDPAIGLLRTISCIRDSRLASEFRTTCVRPFVTKATILALAKLARGSIPWYLQRYRPNEVLRPDFMARYPDQPSDEELSSFRELALDYLPCHIR